MMDSSFYTCSGSPRLVARRDVLRFAGAAAGSIVMGGSAFAATAFVDGRMYALECLGHLPGRGRWLDGRTMDGTVGLAPEVSRGFSGTKWKAHNRGNLVLLECQGHVPGNRWLDGQTMDGRVTLAPEPGSPTGRFSGTLWRPLAVSVEGAVQFVCQGNVKGKRFLDGLTQTGGVVLQKDPNNLSGTRWRIYDYPTV
jgi:hypothetical protein